MILTREEKEKLILDLYNQGKTYKQIAETARVSPRDIKPVLEKAEKEREKELVINTQEGNNGSTGNQNQTQSVSTFSQAYRLFSEGKTPLEVAIELNLKESEATKYYREHWKLRQLHNLDLIYEDIKGDIIHIVKLHEGMKAAGIGVEQAINLIKIANNDLPALELKYNRLKKDIVLLELEKQKSEQIGSQVRILAKMSEDYKQQIEELREKKMALENLIREFENNKVYIKIRRIAEEEVNNTLSKSKELLTLAVSSVIESITKDPRKYNFLVNNNQYNYDKWQTTHPNFIDVYRSLIMDDSQKLFQVMTRELTNNIIDNIILKLSPPLVESSSRQNTQ